MLTQLKRLLDRRTVVTLVAITLLFILALRGSDKVAEAAIEAITWTAVCLVGSNAAQRSIRHFGRSKKKVSRTPPAT
jgi:hypothetical protein